MSPLLIPAVLELYLLWFSFVQNSLSFITIVNTQKQKKIKFKPRIKLNHNIPISYPTQTYLSRDPKENEWRVKTFDSSLLILLI